jgi:hypothetical protein
MSLSGTFDVFSLPEVLRMLASGGKSGTLTVDTAGRQARVELFDGECCGAGDGSDGEPLVADHTPAVLHARLLDVAFETARRRDGTFSFAGDEHPRPQPAATTPVEPVLEELEQLQREWDEISAVVPSADAIPVLAPSLPSDEIVVNGAEWALLARLDGATAVRELPARTGTSLIEVCRALVGLVRRGAIDVAPAPRPVPAAPRPTEVLAEVMLDVAPQSSEPQHPRRRAAAPPTAPGRSEPQPEARPEPEPVASAEAVIDADAPSDAGGEGEDASPAQQHDGEAPSEGDRGAMLRLFSALRE